ncbi:uncharacterized protein Z519_06165 [Cladophialophora bantiana CBS 173.52]|uniref:Uncharacterized protein n=1 Tax=Cladophialophora bantiana (strain ATCC 10958 / CBS 173.52 / CDC B-1940 / NIH 8579) TaxID=1442370 RepID=A0A0D2HRW6_CLAB1|nr:uncharacterized protein Z519_06165 [Cladophialophora bantiana CBS 173.52]KIW93560.1 hypothetical protein Z519_06165 [Cladophialophora bantiana CBS 173.52]
MAAAEYFTAGPRPPLEQQNYSSHVPPQPQRSHSSQHGFSYQPTQPGHLSPQFGVQPPSPYAAPPTSHPPPYQPLNNEPKVHFVPIPATSGQHRPPPPSQPTYSLNQPNFQASPGQQLSPYPPGPYVPQAYQHQPYGPPRHRPHHRPSHSDLPGSGYSSDPEPNRRKHKDRPRRISDNSRSTNADGFIGAAGGGLLGDLLFPGLGTVGGALVGWVGGKDYGKHRKWREEKRDREQERWEREYHRRSSNSRSRSQSRDRDTQRSGHSHGGHDERRHSHERRKGYE